MKNPTLPQFNHGFHLNVWKPNVDALVYHKDFNYVNFSSLKDILLSPYHFAYNWLEAQTPTEEERVSKAMRIGTAFHCAVLEEDKFEETFPILPVFKAPKKSQKKGEEVQESERSHDALALKAQWKKEHPYWVSEKEKHELKLMIESLKSNYAASLLFEKGFAELSGYYEDPETHILCRIRPDFISFKEKTIIDIKTSKHVYKHHFTNDFAKRLYHMQAGMYLEGTEKINGTSIDHFVYVVVQNEAPYEVAVYEADPLLLQKGRELYRSALDRLQKCIERNQWPRYQASTMAEFITLPEWAMNYNGEESQEEDGVK